MKFFSYKFIAVGIIGLSITVFSKQKTKESSGNGCQFHVISPEIAMTITMTGGNYNLFPDME